MRTGSRRPDTTDRLMRISGPAELLDAIPYLIGFQPRQSLVLVGLNGSRLVVTARLDLADAVEPAAIAHTVDVMVDGGADTVVGAVYAEPPAPAPAPIVDHCGWFDFAADVTAHAEEMGCRVGELLLVTGGRWWSLTCDNPACCPPEGRELQQSTSPFAALATYEGRVVLPDREAVEALLEPLPDRERRRLEPALDAEQRAAVGVALRGDYPRWERSVKRAIFRAARDSTAPRADALDDTEVVRFGVALSGSELRNAVWLAVDAGRLDGRPLWRELARRLPPPYDAAPLFLYGWACWRAGDTTQAGMAAERAVRSDPDYVAADLLIAAVTSGMNPHATPRLRRPA